MVDVLLAVLEVVAMVVGGRDDVGSSGVCVCGEGGGSDGRLPVCGGVGGLVCRVVRCLGWSGVGGGLVCRVARLV